MFFAILVEFINCLIGLNSWDYIAEIIIITFVRKLYTGYFFVFSCFESNKLYGPVQITDMPPPLPSSKVTKLGFWSKKMRYVQKRMQKLIFRFLRLSVYEIWSILHSNYLEY